MRSKLLEELFARCCARMGGPLEAARWMGLAEEEALELAAKLRVRAKVEGYEKELESRARPDAVRVLLRLAGQSGLDGIKLTLRGESLSQEELEKLDLAGVSSFKYAPGGGCEVKFFDPARAAELLLEKGGEKGAGAEGFYKALRESVSALALEDTEGEENQGAGDDHGNS